MKVSIIIPTYNQDTYIDQAIKSALAQTYEDIEIIVSDDCSTDKTGEVCKNFQTVQYYRNEKNLGRVGNYHKALYNYATGDYVLMLDGDDYLIDRDYIKSAMHLISRNKDMVMVFARSKILYDIKSELNMPKVKLLATVSSGNDLFINYYKGYTIPHNTALYNRKEAMNIGYYTENIISSDWESILRLIIGHNVGFMDRHVSVWRSHTDNISKSLKVEEIKNNQEYIESTYRHAKYLNIFDNNKLERWRVKMLKRYFSKYIIKSIALRNRDLRREMNKTIREKDKRIFYSILFDIRILVFRLFFVNNRLGEFVVKRIIRDEALIRTIY